MKETTEYEGLMKQSGPLEISLTNDVMFKVMLERNEIVRNNLIAALLHIPVDDIISTTVRNPLNYGDSVIDKLFMLDVDVKMYDGTEINLEMQTNRVSNWPDRSLSYLCRKFDKLKVGDDYSQAVPVYHIGLLDFTLFKDNPVFYSLNRMTDTVTGHIFNGKFSLIVLDLTQISNATDEDKKYGLDMWARLFKVATWEELKAMAQENVVFAEAANTAGWMQEDFWVRELAIRKAQAAFDERERNERIAKLETVIADKEEQLASKEEQLASKDEQLANKDAQLADAYARIAELEKKVLSS